MFANVSEEEQHKEGFLTVSDSFELLKNMNAVCPHMIAKDKVVGYTLIKGTLPAGFKLFKSHISGNQDWELIILK